MKRFFKIVFSMAWIIYCVSRLVKYSWHYSFLDWLVAFSICAFPFVITKLLHKAKRNTKIKNASLTKTNMGKQSNENTAINVSHLYNDQNALTFNGAEHSQKNWAETAVPNYQFIATQDGKNDFNPSNNIFVDEYFDYITAIFLNAYKTGSSLLNDEQYWGYIRYHCGISHPRRFHEELISNGYFEKPSLYDYLCSYTVADLKIILDSIGQKKTGKKADLIDKIIENLSEEEKNRICNDSDIFTLSEKGNLFIKEHADYILLKKHPDGSITFTDYITAKKELPFKASFYDVLWFIYNKRQHNCLFNKEFEFLSDIYSSMAKILIDENRFDGAVYYAVKSLYIELSGIDQYDYIETYRKSKGCSIEAVAEMYHPFLPIYLINLFKRVKDYYNQSIFKKVMVTTEIPFSITTETELEQFTQDIILDNIMSEDEYRDMMTRRYKNYLKKIQTASYRNH